MTRKTFTIATPAPDASLRRVITAIVTQVVSFFTALQNRAAVQTLAELDERVLKDIGLSRSDVDGALAEPIHKDPSRLLAHRSRERFVRSRAAAVKTA